MSVCLCFLSLSFLYRCDCGSFFLLNFSSRQIVFFIFCSFVPFCHTAFVILLLFLHAVLFRFHVFKLRERKKKSYCIVTADVLVVVLVKN